MEGKRYNVIKVCCVACAMSYFPYCMVVRVMHILVCLSDQQLEMALKGFQLLCVLFGDSSE